MTVVVLATHDLPTVANRYGLYYEDDFMLWHEPDYDDALTAIAINPACELKWLAKLPLLGSYKELKR